jgi:SAM-dependent methyltransferase
MTYHYGNAVRTDILRMIPPDGRVIGSIGCGGAGAEAELVKGGREVHGVDISPEGIAMASKVLTSARMIRPDDFSPFDPDSLDGLILGDVLEHVPLAWEALKQYARAVRPGGWVVISVPNMRGLRVLYDFGLRGEWPEHEMGIFDRTHVQVMTHKRLIRWCAAAGLTPERYFDVYSFGGPPWVRIADWLTLRLFHNSLQMQIQGRFRKTAQRPPAS